MAFHHSAKDDVMDFLGSMSYRDVLIANTAERRSVEL